MDLGDALLVRLDPQRGKLTTQRPGVRIQRQHVESVSEELPPLLPNLSQQQHTNLQAVTMFGCYAVTSGSEE
jgi:hypothetical protein